MRLIARGIEFSTLQSDGGKADEAESLVYGVARRSDERELLTRDVEVAGVACVDWFNHRRLHGTITAGPGHSGRARSRLLP